MKYLLLIRHAKTEPWGYGNDIERSLTDRGVEDCNVMGTRLKKIGFVPQLVKISPSKRTRQTAKFLAKSMDWKKDKVVIIDNLYQASAKAIYNEIALTDNSIHSIAIICHNPGITDVFNSFGTAAIDNMPTCGMGLFVFDITNWEDLENETGELEWVSWPKKNES